MLIINMSPRHRHRLHHHQQQQKLFSLECSTDKTIQTIVPKSVSSCHLKGQTGKRCHQCSRAQ